MRPRLQAARDQLAAVLARRPGAAAAELATALGVSVPTLHRMLAELGPALLSAGRARRTRYALRASLRGEPGPWPLHAIDQDGRAQQAGELSLLAPQGSHWLPLDAHWPLPDESRDGWWPGLPMVLQDMRPQGYLGRQFARACSQALRVAPDPAAWSDADTAFVLAQWGSDCSGNLILGQPAFALWQALRRTEPRLLPRRGLLAAYARLADVAVAAGVAGSRAAGEFPKFPAWREQPGAATPHVLVKFSGAGASAAVRRWADLLVCEHLALEALGSLPGLQSAASRVLQQDGGRTFLEVERFDRHGLWGRSALISLATVDAVFMGAGTADWAVLARRLGALGLVDDATVAAIDRLWWFGRLIANTDMHTGNLSFRPVDGRLQLAPAYDMLPTLFAPLPGGELPQRQFEPPLPLPAQRPAWQQASAAARVFWQAVATDGRISAGFRRLAAASGRALAAAVDLA